MSQSKDDRIEQLSEVVSQLAGELQILVNALDELREEVQWANRNSADPVLSQGPRFRLTSLPLDPGTKDWQLNRVDEATIKKLRTELPSAGKPGASQSRLF